MEGYDKAQICLNGHVMNSHIEEDPHNNKIFCTKCGERTITACTSCRNPIQGLPFNTGGRYIPPAYCHYCGKPYSWTEKRIQVAIQAFVEFDNLDESEKETIEDDINNIAKDVPEAEMSAKRIKKIWNKYGNIAYNVIMELASKTMAEILKNP